MPRKARLFMYAGSQIKFGMTDTEGLLLAIFRLTFQTETLPDNALARWLCTRRFRRCQELECL